MNPSLGSDLPFNFSQLFGPPPPPPDLLFPHLWHLQPKHITTSPKMPTSNLSPCETVARTRSSYRIDGQERDLSRLPSEVQDFERTVRPGSNMTNNFSLPDWLIRRSNGISFSVDEQCDQRGNQSSHELIRTGTKRPQVSSMGAHEGLDVAAVSAKMAKAFGGGGGARNTGMPLWQNVAEDWKRISARESETKMQLMDGRNSKTKQSSFVVQGRSGRSEVRTERRDDEADEDEDDDDEEEEEEDEYIEVATDTVETDETESKNGGHNVGCVVCGDKSSGKHYGQHTCEGCKSFFKRSVRRKLTYTCRGNRQCPIDVHNRNQCQYCRFQKCIKAGMRKEAVQQGRLPPFPNSYNPFFFHASALLGSVPPPSSSMNSSMSNGPPFSANFISMLLRAEPLSQRYDHRSISTAMFPGQGESTPWTLPSGDRPIHAASTATSPNLFTDDETKKEASEMSQMEGFSDFGMKVLLNSIEWARNIPLFNELALSDQLIMLQNAWPELFILNVAQGNSTGLTLNELITTASDRANWMTKSRHNNNHQQSDGVGNSGPSEAKEKCLGQSEAGDETTTSERLNHVQLDHFQDQLDRLRMLQLDLVEFVCLKAIVLFNSESPGLRDPVTVDCIQEKVQSALEEYDKYQSFHQQPLRFGRLLLRLPKLRQVSASWLQQLFFPQQFDKVNSSSSSNHNKNTVNQLIEDLLLRGNSSPSRGCLDKRLNMDSLRFAAMNNHHHHHPTSPTQFIHRGFGVNPPVQSTPTTMEASIDSIHQRLHPFHSINPTRHWLGWPGSSPFNHGPSGVPIPYNSSSIKPEKFSCSRNNIDNRSTMHAFPLNMSSESALHHTPSMNPYHQFHNQQDGEKGIRESLVDRRQVNFRDSRSREDINLLENKIKASPDLKPSPGELSSSSSTATPLGVGLPQDVGQNRDRVHHSGGRLDGSRDARSSTSPTDSDPSSHTNPTTLQLYYAVMRQQLELLYKQNAAINPIETTQVSSSAQNRPCPPCPPWPLASFDRL